MERRGGQGRNPARITLGALPFRLRIMHVIQVLADHVFATRTGKLTPEARSAAIRCVLDLMSATVAGFPEPAAEATRQVACNLYGDGASTIWFSGRSSLAVGAAFCNSAAASVLDLDDGHRIARGHPGASVITAAMATAEETEAGAEELLVAIVLGYEVCVRIAAARSVNARSGVWCGYGAAAAAGWLRELSTEKLSDALAIAGMTAPQLLSTSGGPRYPSPVGNDIKEGIPWGTVTAMTAVHLAQAGVSGPLDILDHAPHYDRERLLKGLGSDQPMICQTYFKPYACCRHIHAPVDALAMLMADHAITSGEIRRIDVHVYEGALLISNRRSPLNLVDVQFSIPYCLGMVALMGTSCLLPVGEGILNRPDIAAVAQKVELHLDAGLNARFPGESLCRVIITTDKARYESPVTVPRGEASDPLSWDALRAKFLAATCHVMLPQRQQALLDAVDRLVAGELEPLLCALAEPLA